MVGNKLNIVILANGNFPVGMASTNRLVSYSKGLVELGHKVSVVILCPHEKEGDVIINKLSKGSYYGIDYEYASKTSIWPKNNFKKIYLLVLGLLRSLFLVYKYSKKEKVDSLLFASGTTKFRYTAPFYVLSKILKASLIREKSEYPIFELYPDKYAKLYSVFARKYVYRFFDGFLIMTNPLMEYFSTVAKKKAKLTLIPMTVEPARFSNCEDRIEESSKYIAYCGYLWGNKDGTQYLIDAFNEISDKHTDVKLYLIGDLSNKIEYAKLIDYISNLGILDRIVLTGRVDRDDMAKYLKGASILALARPKSLQAKGGFPTKLGEYLSTGNPVVITKVGDIPKYLVNGESAFLAEPGDSHSFAERLDFALSNEEISKEVGLNGEKLAYGVFNYKVQANNIAQFLEKCNK